MQQVNRVIIDLRYYIRGYIANSDRAAEAAGINPQEYLLMLSIAGLPPHQRPTVATLAKRMVVEHNTAVQLIDRTEKRGLVTRTSDPVDRRYKLVTLTPEGEDLLHSLAGYHMKELRSAVPEMVEALHALLAKQDWAMFGEEPT